MQMINATDTYKIWMKFAVGIKILIISRVLSMISSVFIDKSSDNNLFITLHITPPDVFVLYSNVWRKGKSRALHLLQDPSPRSLYTWCLGALSFKSLVIALQYGVTSPLNLASNLFTLALYLTNFVYSIEFI